MLYVAERSEAIREKVYPVRSGIADNASFVTTVLTCG